MPVGVGVAPGWGHQRRETIGSSAVSCRLPAASKVGGLACSSCLAGSTGRCQRLRLHQRCASRQLVRS